MKKLVLSLMTTAFVAACGPQHKVDLIVHNATIISVDENMATHEAMAIREGRIVELGAEHQILNKYHASQVVDARKRFIYPGFIDAHCHFLGYGLSQANVNLTGTTSFAEMVEKIKAHAEATDNEWIVGRGWNENDWDVKEFPSRETLDALFRHRKIALKRVDGHAMLVTSNVLQQAGITATTQVKGGTVLFEQGILIDAAMDAVEAIIPKPRASQVEAALLHAERDCFANGLTSVTDAGLEVTHVDQIAQMHEQGTLKMRVTAMYSADPKIMPHLAKLRRESDRLTAHAVKIYADGSLGSRGAKLLAPYSDDTATTGLTITPEDSLLTWASACQNAGFQLCVHCIGDGANRSTLRAMALALGGTNDLRWRIEHAQVVNPADRSLFGRYNIIPSVQPTHTTSDMAWAGARLGQEREAHAYATKSLLDENGMIALGTDFPVEAISPIATFYAAVARKNRDGQPAEGYFPDQRLSREEALKGMSIWAAIANFDEAKYGSLTVGKFADFVILDRNLLTCDEQEILETQVLQTWLNGELVYEK